MWVNIEINGYNVTGNHCVIISKMRNSDTDELAYVAEIDYEDGSSAFYRLNENDGEDILILLMRRGSGLRYDEKSDTIILYDIKVDELIYIDNYMEMPLDKESRLKGIDEMGWMDNISELYEFM